MPSPRAIINCRHCKAVTGTIDLTGEAAERAYILGLVRDVRCPRCNAWVDADAVRGSYNPAKRCGGACLHAKRGDCECACAGLNHGSGG